MKKTDNFLMGADIGSSSCKISIVDDTGRILAYGNTDYFAETKKEGWAEQNPDVWFQAFKSSVRQCLKESRIPPSKIYALSVCGPAHNAVLLDKNNEVLRPAILWWDQRSTHQSDWLLKKFGRTIFKTTLQPVHPSWTLAQLLWIKENEPYIFKKIHRIIIGKDFITYRLTGSWQTDWYDAMGTQLFNGKAKKWSKEICRILNLPVKCLPPVLNSLDIAGHVTPCASIETGLPVGLPVAVGSGDSVVEAFGVAAVEPMDCLVKLATTGTVSVVTAKQHPSKKAMSYFHVIPDLFYTITATNSGASSAQWFYKTFHDNAKDSYETMEQLAEKVAPGSEGLIFHPYLKGERSPYWDPDLRADFIGISHTHKKQHFIRAVFEGVAFSLRDCMELIRSMDIPIKRTFLVGGGARIKLWRQITSDILATRLHIPKVPSLYVATYGAALLAGLASGVFSSLKEINKIAGKTDKTNKPDPNYADQYEKTYTVYKEITRNLQPIYKKLKNIYSGQKSIK